MVEVSLLLLGSAGLEAISHEVNQATSWARKAFDVVNETHQSHKGKYDFAYLRILHHLAMVHKVNVSRICFYLFINCMFSSLTTTMTKPVSCWNCL